MILPAVLDHVLRRVDMNFVLEVRALAFGFKDGVQLNEHVRRIEANTSTLQSARPEGWGGHSQGRVMTDMTMESERRGRALGRRLEP